MAEKSFETCVSAIEDMHWRRRVQTLALSEGGSDDTRIDCGSQPALGAITFGQTRADGH